MLPSLAKAAAVLAAVVVEGMAGEAITVALAVAVVVGEVVMVAVTAVAMAATVTKPPHIQRNE
jgi:hypothetical protein